MGEIPVNWTDSCWLVFLVTDNKINIKSLVIGEVCDDVLAGLQALW